MVSLSKIKSYLVNSKMMSVLEMMLSVTTSLVVMVSVE